MLATRNIPVLELAGIDQQDFNELQLVKGAYPYQIGAQQRIPGKSISQIHPSAVGSILVFYMVFGRTYVLTDFGSLQIEEIDIPPISIPALPPKSTSWFDNFAGYATGLISRIWAGGAWLIGVGVCETIIEGEIDAFRTLGSGVPTDTIETERQPHIVPGGIPIPNTTPTPFGLGSLVSSKVFAGTTTVQDGPLPYPSVDYPADNSGWLPGGHGDLPFLLYPLNYASADTRFFRSEDYARSQSYYSGGSVFEYQTASGFYSLNAINTGHITANVGDVITLEGTRDEIINQAGDFGNLSTIEIVLGVWPNLPETFEVNSMDRNKLSFDASAPPGSHRYNITGTRYTFANYNVYPPE